MDDTIYALSSGAPPAGIGVIRISGIDAGRALETLAGSLPPARSPRLRTLHDADGDVLDVALVLWFPGPATATGEDLAEIHCHGGRAVVAAILASLACIDGLREAEPGEFTRRAFTNGRIDLAEAEGLADLLAAETELQRRGALLAAGGDVSRRIEDWRGSILGLAASVEAVIDFADEDDVASLPPSFDEQLRALVAEIRKVAERPAAERLRDGVRVVLAGPPNAGKSSLFNALLADDAAIVTAEAGTTRDVLERPVSIAGVPFVLIDTAGVRDQGAGAIEEIGIERARREIVSGQIVLWLGDARDAPKGALLVQSKSDLADTTDSSVINVSAVTGSGLEALLERLVELGRAALPPVDRVAFNRRQKALALAAAEHLEAVDVAGDLLVAAENLRSARQSLDALVGRDSTEEMLDALFGRFCIGK
ncbi:tRNA uridine-5-carboxymethylaminomethyl(34) synthesis GTPase MnmE [Erythrobacter sp.]|uniref:tRNA uridine-5-carboxymethylaminomethyl(34) synthesis GTPase MnmE n=1 Tax=Erythrobacter sp. TaxID=1042 RepID=UPI001B016781|nr:tRNA uridine-5-carboxymethylaminomethyl(34) synthesis GTPase MnmE [Erythrobacter sp.]MBO6527331.1 tRNA uridine-5-carboxymethylaminomethyl(34) synthesis GTPase MnmE [Erythrobacter sp.]MBO6530923.1 tRNA uridine-5-carboxymethylaminomethyl(34) synthesis GTPase MnmE [Erythrobacter sp.]